MTATSRSPFRIITHESGNQTIHIVRGELDPPSPAPQQGSVAWYVPYTAVHPQTAAAAPADAVWIDVSASDIAYYAALRAIWENGETFAVLEHDVVCRPDAIKSLEECPEPWCLYGYADWCHEACREGWRNALGCTRFRAEAIEAMPDALSSIPRDGWVWNNVCDGLGNNLRAAGLTHHWHGPPIGHHRETHTIKE